MFIFVFMVFIKKVLGSLVFGVYLNVKILIFCLMVNKVLGGGKVVKLKKKKLFLIKMIFLKFGERMFL